MSVLLLRLAGPMQSWGTRSRFSNRDTGLEPSKSGIVGLLCAAVGWPRDSETFVLAGRSLRLEEFARSLSMAVRVDREGRLMRDYHTAENCRKADGTMPQRSKRFVESERFYLADADFLVAVGGDRPLLEALTAALRQPIWPLFLGRKSFVPALPVCEAIVAGEPADVLRRSPWRKRWRGEGTPERLRCVIEVEYGTGEARQDVPLSFVSLDRRFAVRHVRDDAPITPTHILEPDQEADYVPEQTGAEPA